MLLFSSIFCGGNFSFNSTNQILFQLNNGGENFFDSMRVNTLSELEDQQLSGNVFVIVSSSSLILSSSSFYNLCFSSISSSSIIMG
jgi:hypothetical protein